MERVHGGAGRSARRAAELYGAVRAGETDIARLRERGEPRRVLGLLEFATQGRCEERDAYLRRLAACPDAAAMVRPRLGPAERARLDVAGARAPAVPSLLAMLPRGTEEQRRYALEALAIKRPMEATGPLFDLLAAAGPDEPSWYLWLIEDTVSRIVIGRHLFFWRWAARTVPVPPAVCVPLLLRQSGRAAPGPGCSPSSCSVAAATRRIWTCSSRPPATRTSRWPRKRSSPCGGWTSPRPGTASRPC